MKNPFDLSGKTAIVTGCGSGIGQGMAVALAKAGVDIISFDRSEPDKTGKLVESAGCNFSWVKVDLMAASHQQLRELIDETARTKRIDIFVHNAGTCPRGEIEEFSIDMWDDTIKLNLSTAWSLSQAVSRHMVEQGGGKIIFTGSLLSFQGGLNVPSYAASKHGIAGLAKSLANSLAVKNVNVNVIAPGYIETKLTKPIQDDPQRNESILERIPANRWGKPEDIGGVCVFLASQSAEYIHGAVIPVDGGWMGR